MAEDVEKAGPFAWAAGLSQGRAAGHSGRVVPEEIKSGILMHPSNSTSTPLKELRAGSQREICVPVFTAAKVQKQPRSPTDE